MSSNHRRRRGGRRSRLLTSLMRDSSRAGTSTGARSHPSGAPGCGGATADVAPLPPDAEAGASSGAVACGRSSAASGPTALAWAD